MTRVTKFEYDEAGNQTRVITPRGVETTDDADDFVAQTVYDKLNRPIEKLTPFDKDDVQHKTPDKTIYAYDPVGRIKEVSAPPSQGQAIRNVTKYSYFDNGWIRTSTDPWDIVTVYDYTPLGHQASRTLTSAGGSSGRTMTWDYFPDGKLKSRSDSGVPVGLHVALTDNSDTGYIELAGNWSTATAGQGFQGYDYRSTARGTGATTFTWKPVIPADGSYEVFVKYPSGVAGTATNTPYKVETGAATSTVPVNQTQRGGEWVSIGSFTFTAGTAAKITVSDNADGTVLADAVKLVRNNASDPDNESKTLAHAYDANGGLTALTDSSPGAKVDAYAMTYNGLNQLTKVEEKLGSVVKSTTTFAYDENGAPLTRGHDRQSSVFEYDVRDLIAKVTNTETGGAAKVSSYTYTDRGQVKEETKSNGNKTVYGYHLDGALASQVESKSSGVLVAQHFLDYSPNGHRIKDASKIQNADNASAYLDEVREYTYDPRDRIRNVTKKSAAGAVLKTEDYTHDANNNVVSQTVEGKATSFNYDRNRLLSSSSAGVIGAYNYDPFGRLDTVTGAGQIIESYKYDGFDRTVSHSKQGANGLETTTYSYDPLDRTTSKTEKDKTTDFAYLGLTDKVVSEEIAGQLQRTYQYDAFGQRLVQIKKDTDGAGSEVAEDSYYGYNPHTDVETLTKDNGDTRATYGYTAYGSDDKEAFTGIDKPDVQQPGKQPFNFYRYNGKRFDPSSGSYDMGFRDYNPGLNRFMTRDMYNGALSDMELGSDPFTGNRYAFVGGNPITGVEYDGHRPEDEPGYCLGYLGDCGIDPTAGSQVTGHYSPQQLSSMGVLTSQQPSTAPRTGFVPSPRPQQTTTAPPTGLLSSLIRFSWVGMVLGGATSSSADPQWQERSIDTKRGREDCAAAGKSTVGYIIYHNLDHHDRATGAEACLKGWIQPDEETLFTPPGWKPGMDRGHIIARMFGGSNTKEENFVPLYPNANRIEMRQIEDEIVRRIKRGETVYYAVTPIYTQHTGPNMYIPTAIHLYAYSSSGTINETILDK